MCLRRAIKLEPGRRHSVQGASIDGHQKIPLHHLARFDICTSCRAHHTRAGYRFPRLTASRYPLIHRNGCGFAPRSAHPTISADEAGGMWLPMYEIVKQPCGGLLITATGSDVRCIHQPHQNTEWQQLGHGHRAGQDTLHSNRPRNELDQGPYLGLPQNENRVDALFSTTTKRFTRFFAVFTRLTENRFNRL